MWELFMVLLIPLKIALAFYVAFHVYSFVLGL